MNEQCLCLLDSKKDDEVAVTVCAQGHERYYPAPPHPTPPVTDHEWAVPVSAGQQERWWGCCDCVCSGTWTLLPRPTAPHPTGNWSWMSSACVCWTARKIMTLTNPTSSPVGSVCTTETLSCAQVSRNPVCAAESILCAQVSRRPLFIYIIIFTKIYFPQYIYTLDLEPDMAASLVAGSPWRRWLRGKSEPQCTYSEKKWEKYIFGSKWIKGNSLGNWFRYVNATKATSRCTICWDGYNMVGHLEFVRRCASGVFSSLIVCQIQTVVSTSESSQRHI